MKRRCACGTTFAHHQSHFRHVKRCATHARWLEQGGVFELGAYDGNLKLDEVVETAASATDAFYRVALYLFADGAFNCNRSVRVAANGGGWRVRRRRRVGEEQPTSWEWEVIDDGAAVAAEVRAVVVAALKDVMEAQVPGSQLGVKACAAMNTAHDAPRLMRVLRERRVMRPTDLDDEERAEMRAATVEQPRQVDAADVDQLVDQISTKLAHGIVFAAEAFGKLWELVENAGAPAGPRLRMRLARAIAAAE